MNRKIKKQSIKFYTLEKAMDEIPTIKDFTRLVCDNCKAEWYCPSHCATLEKTKKIDYQRIIRAYVRHDGDLRKVCNYIDRAVLKPDTRGWGSQWIKK